ncbi:MAG: hypothetical protein MJ252_16750 [archaeon]|nr:hypothetical protein [archaeon]
MGLGPSKSKIRDILLRASSQGSGTQSLDSTFLRCNHRITTVASLPISTTNYNPSMDDQNSYMDMSVSSTIEESSTATQEADPITSLTSKCDNQIYPQRAIGTLKAVFRHGEKSGTCFLIESNVLVTAATNVFDVEYGGKAKEVMTTFSEEKIKADNILLVSNLDRRKKKSDYLAVMVFTTNVLDEWLGVEMMALDVLKEKDLYLVGSIGEEEDEKKSADNIASILNKENPTDPSLNNSDKKELFKKSDLHQINVTVNSIMGRNDAEKLKVCYGAPVFYKECNNNSYVVGFLTSESRIEFLNQENMRLLVEGVIKGKASKKKDEKKIEEDKIEKLDLSRNDFGPLDIKYLSEFNLKNLIDLDLSSNSIKPQGVFYFTQGKYPCLKTLNLNFNEIGDEGLYHLSNAVLNELEQLFLFHNNISKAGVEALCKADFAQNLVVLSLSENQNIMDEGVQCFEKQKNWRRLMILNLNRTGLTDQAVKYLIGSIMPNLKKIHLKGNNFTNDIAHEISAWKLNGVMIDYLDDAQKRKRKRKAVPKNVQVDS